MAAPNLHRPRLLTVDDEPSVVAGIAANFRREFDVVTATSGAEGLEAIDKGPGFAIVLSDMHMPQMNGIAFLSEVRRRSPDTVRVLLTGNADLETAVAAVNEGQLFRFLRKPAQRDELKHVLLAAAEHHALLTAERVLLEQTLRGTVEAMMDMLAVVQPAAFGQAARLRKLVREVAASAGVVHPWRLEIAAMFSQLSLVAASPEALEKMSNGAPLDDHDKAAFTRGTNLVERMLARIPRLDGVHAILVEERALGLHPPFGVETESQRSAQVLHVCAAFAHLTASGMADNVALQNLRAREPGFDERCLNALAELCGVRKQRQVLRTLPVRELAVGMVLAEDLHTTTGVLLARRGYEVTESFVERAEGFARGFVREPVKVLVQAID